MEEQKQIVCVICNWYLPPGINKKDRWPAQLWRILEKGVIERNIFFSHGKLCYALIAASLNAPTFNYKQKFQIRKKHRNSLHEYTPRQNFFEKSSNVLRAADKNRAPLRNNCA